MNVFLENKIQFHLKKSTYEELKRQLTWNLKEVIDSLENLIEGKELEEFSFRILGIKARYIHLEKEFREELISDNDYKVALSRIRKSLLFLINELEGKKDYNLEWTKETEGGGSWGGMSIVGLFVIIIFVFFLLPNENAEKKSSRSHRPSQETPIDSIILYKNVKLARHKLNELLGKLTREITREESSLDIWHGEAVNAILLVDKINPKFKGVMQFNIWWRNCKRSKYYDMDCIKSNVEKILLQLEGLQYNLRLLQKVCQVKQQKIRLNLDNMKKKKSFDFDRFKEEAISKLKSGEDLLGSDGVLTPLLKEFLEESLDGELDAQLSKDTAPNRRNGKGRKTVKTELGQVDIETPRDRAGRFSLQLVPKRSRTLGRGLERQIIALYARGNSYADIRDYLADMYGVEASTTTISRITDKILPLLQELRNRPLGAVYPIVWLDAIHYKVRQE